MRDEITTSSRSGDTRYTRLNLLGWAMICPYALELLIHGSTPRNPIQYPTADESRRLHEYMKNRVIDAISSVRLTRGAIVSVEPEYEHRLCMRIDDVLICANSRADIVFTLRMGEALTTLYVEVTTRIHVVKPWQAILRGITLYYERRLPVWIVIVSPETIMYKLLEDKDQSEILRKTRRRANTAPSSNLCSLCELVHLCPYKTI